MAYLIVGLGNPGKKYENTRHNLGFLIVGEMIKKFEAVEVNTKLQSLLWTSKIGDQKIYFGLPQTFMNLSGTAISPLMKEKNIESSQLIVIHDDLDLPLGELRVKKGSSAAGHNGVQSIIDLLGTKDFTRVRVGIGRPITELPIEEYVLTKFNVEEKKLLPEIFNQAISETEKLFLK